MTQEIEEVQEIEPVQDQQEIQVESSEEVSQQTQKNDADRNWEQVRQVLQFQKQKIEELESRVGQKNAPAEEPDEFSELDPGDYLTVGQAKALAQKLAAKTAKEEASRLMDDYMTQQKIQVDEQRLRAKHDDYDYVVDNFAVPLIKNNPALAIQVKNSKNPAETAYLLGKMSDNYGETMSKQPSTARAEKVLKNANRPVSSSAVGSPLRSQADQFSKLDPRNPSDARTIYEQSQRYARGA